jgi:GNAT superfamily N-acetyltransferase
MSVKVTYVQMFFHNRRTLGSPRNGVSILHAKKPTVGYYRFLYDKVGRQWNWAGRENLSDASLLEIIHDPRDEIHVLYVDGVPAGFVEMDRRVDGEIEISFFGLMPEFIGQGLGKYFLQWTIDKAWSYGPKRLWLHTDTQDHPAALPNYLKAGFAIYKEEIRDDW